MARDRRDQEGPSLFDLQAPYLNSFAGTDLDGKGVEATVNILDPFTPFAEDAQYYDDASATVYFKNVWGAIIKDFEAHKVMPAGKVTPEDVVWGGDIWHAMVDYKTKSDALFAKLSSATLADEKKALFEKAKAFYAAYRLPRRLPVATAAAS